MHVCPLQAAHLITTQSLGFTEHFCVARSQPILGGCSVFGCSRRPNVTLPTQTRVALPSPFSCFSVPSPSLPKIVWRDDPGEDPICKVCRLPSGQCCDPELFHLPRKTVSNRALEATIKYSCIQDVLFSHLLQMMVLLSQMSSSLEVVNVIRWLNNQPSLNSNTSDQAGSFCLFVCWAARSAPV